MGWMAGWVCGALLLLSGGLAAASELGCAASFDDRPSAELTGYGPTTVVMAKVTVSNLDPAGQSVASRIDSAALSEGGNEFGAPLTLDGGQSAEKTVFFTLAGYPDCLRLAALDGTADDRWVAKVEVGWDRGLAACSAELVCRPPLAQRPAAVTRPLGFFAVREAPLQACLARGPVDVGTLQVATLGDALGLLWAGPAKFEGGALRSERDRAWLLLARQALVASCNARLFGSSPADPALLTHAQDALRGDGCTAMGAVRSQLEGFNDSGGQNELPAGFEPGEPSPVNAKAVARDPTSASPGSCSGGAP